MTYYHYTSLDALQGIIRSSENNGKRLCFWATRYDCFVDKEEYLLGIDFTRKYLSIMEDEYNLKQDRRIAAFFRRETIENNVNLPNPYVISVTARNDNAYMWENYADHGNGAVLEIDFPQTRGIYDTAIIYKLEKCIYEDTIGDAELIQIVYEAYTDGGFALLQGNKELFLGLLQKYPQLFVRFIAMYVLYFFAPRIKRNFFKQEEEFRMILSAPVPAYTEFIHANAPLIDALTSALNMVLKSGDIVSPLLKEKMRTKDDRHIYYREFFLPESALTRIFVRNFHAQSTVEALLDRKGFENVKCDILKY
nr:MAG TPA: Putative abortive phage resistance protein AbiGi, antitoxin [Caudoviricetes sp.]